MPTFNCTTCGYTPNPGTPYLESPCATCKLAVEQYNTHRPALFDSGNWDDDDEAEFLGVEDKDLQNIDENDIDVEVLKKVKEATEITKVLREVIEKQVFLVASGLVLSLVKMAKESPVLFEILIKKMQYPYLSYSEIGASMEPKCSKQNVLYHLKHAVEMFPDLNSAILTDTRFSGGHYALKTIAEANKQNKAKQRIQGILYGEANPAFIARGLKEITRICSLPFMADKDIINFNPFIKDEAANVADDQDS